jgi:CelD/BcsL family acetyltransferase involved in cellulose biosynthesis
MQIRVARAGELDPIQRKRWASVQEAIPELASPFFRPEFTDAVSVVRDDVFVACVEHEGVEAGFFPFQRSRLGLGSPVGGQRSNYHGVVAEPWVPWDAAGLVRGCGLRTFEFHHLLATQVEFSPYHAAVESSPVIDASAGFDAYLKTLSARGSDVAARTQQQVRRVEREAGPVSFEADSHDPALLTLLLRWKSAQYRATGHIDQFDVPWNVALVRRLHETSTPGFAGTLSVLRVGDSVAAMAFSLRSRATWHYWFPAYDPAYATYSPGMILLLRLVQVVGTRGGTIDLGRGEEPYKTRLATATTEVAEGRVVPSRSLAAAARIRAGAIRAASRTPLARPLRRARRELRLRAGGGLGV